MSSNNSRPSAISNHGSSTSSLRTGAISSRRESGSNHSALSNRSGYSRAPGGSTAHKTGSPTTAHGNSAAATAVIAFPTTAIADTGPSHGFRINTLPFLVVGGYPLFQYQGYWISAVDPWPEYWGNDWYDNDDVYVNYVGNGYYLYNRRYPTTGIAINISL